MHSFFVIIMLGTLLHWSDSVIPSHPCLQLDSDITAGSIESTRAEKAAYAQKSLEFNKQDATFCELFPGLL
jgi:hypothetical protein